MNQISEIVRLKECNLSDRQIAKAINISRPKVKEFVIKAEQLKLTSEMINTMPANEVEKIFYEEKINPIHEKLHEYFPDYLKKLKEKGMTIQILWQEYKQKHIGGLEYSQFCYHFQKFGK